MSGSITAPGFPERQERLTRILREAFDDKPKTEARGDAEPRLTEMPRQEVASGH